MPDFLLPVLVLAPSTTASRITSSMDKASQAAGEPPSQLANELTVLMNWHILSLLSWLLPNIQVMFTGPKEILILPQSIANLQPFFILRFPLTWLISFSLAVRIFSTPTKASSFNPELFIKALASSWLIK